MVPDKKIIDEEIAEESNKKAVAYQNKITALKKRIIINGVILATFILAMVLFNMHYEKIKKDYNNEAKKLKLSIADLITKSADIEAKINDAKKYRQLWNGADGTKKKFSDIKINDITERFNRLAEKYLITNQIIKIGNPEVLKEGVYKQKVLETNVSNCSLSFKSFDDATATNFINEFLDLSHGYIVITNLSIKRVGSGYSNKDLIGISTGQTSGQTSVTLDFSWHFFKKSTIKKK